MTARRLSVAIAAFALVATAIAFTQTASVPAQARLKAFDAQIAPIVASMSLDEKVGQMTQPDHEFIKDPADVATLFVGSVLSGGGSDPRTNSVEDWTAMYETYQSQALKTRLKIPLLYGVDAVHGHNNVVGAVVFPHNVGLGATRDRDAGRRDRPPHRERSEDDRHQLGIRSLRRGAPRRSLGPRLRGIRRRSRAGCRTRGGCRSRPAGSRPEDRR